MGDVDVLLIVARERPDVYEAMRREFADTRDRVQVVLDRRFGERRRQSSGFTPDRRRGERRHHDIEADLRSLGRAIVRIEPAGGGAAPAPGRS
jgi:hypothetical protein